MKKLSMTVLIALCFLTFSIPALAQRTITDQLERTVTIPDTIKRAVVLQHQTLDIAIQLDAAGQVVGILEKWQKYLPGAAKSIPDADAMPTPGGLKNVNMEALLTLNPDIVFVTHYAPEEMIKMITDAGIPVLGITLFDASYEQASRLNPDLKDADRCYTEGLKGGIRIIAEVFNKQSKGEKLISVIDANQKNPQEPSGFHP